MPGDLQDPEQYSPYPLSDYSTSEKLDQKSDLKLEKGVKLKKMTRTVCGRFITIEELKQKSREVVENGFDLRKYLVNQEIRMYANQGNQVDQKDFDWICERRGFTPEERSQVYAGIKKMGLANRLNV